MRLPSMVVLLFQMARCARLISGLLISSVIFCSALRRIRSLARFIKIVAGLCDLLFDEVCAILKGSPGHAAHEHLSLLAAEWRDLLFPGLDAVNFADAFAQTITFAMLLARVDGISFEGLPLHEIGRLLGKKHSLIGRAFSVLTDGSAIEELRTVGTLRQVIGSVAITGLDDVNSDVYAELYERFLAIYDPDLRTLSGSFYTPRPLAAFMVRLVDDILRSELGQPWASRTTSLSWIRQWEPEPSWSRY